MADIHSYDPPERFVVGTVGEPGQRVFYLQARTGTRLTTVAVEKQQVIALAERVDELLDELMAQAPNEALIPAVTPFDLKDDAPLEHPLEEDFRGGTMTLSWDVGTEQVVVEVFSLTPGEDPDEDEEPAEALVVRLRAGAARAFVERARAVVDAGRPDCPFCGLPLDPQGHLCVRANGFRRRDP
ncbi:MAG: DUF3090 domain-containing protein [Nocardioides sp.]|uniref:DUF3090 domain-containing protein n=1 Tax=Nocardioides sp. TaxID=35761 RepID=UPI003F0802B1